MRTLAYILAALLIACVTWVADLGIEGRLAISAPPTEKGQVSASPSEACPAPSFPLAGAGRSLNRKRGEQVRMRVSGYCPGACCCDQFADGITASGKPVTANGGLIVAAPPSIPFGTVMDIPGYGRAVVLDRGGAIKGDRLDILFPSHQAALEWGIRYLDVTIRTKG